MRESFFFFEKIIWKDSKLTAVAPTLADKKYPCCSVAGSLTTAWLALARWLLRIDIRLLLSTATNQIRGWISSVPGLDCSTIPRICVSRASNYTMIFIGCKSE